MAQENRVTLKEYFEKGDFPTEAQFADLIDSLLNFIDDGTPASQSEVDLNTTHRGSDGKNHSDVVLNNAKPGYNTAASGLPSTSGAGNIDMSRANDYYSETAITGDVTWGLTNIVIDKTVSIDVKADGNAINLVQAGVTFKGAVIAGVVQGLDASESNLIAIWAQTATIMWVTVILNEV